MYIYILYSIILYIALYSYIYIYTHYTVDLVNVSQVSEGLASM